MQYVAGRRQSPSQARLAFQSLVRCSLAAVRLPVVHELFLFWLTFGCILGILLRLLAGTWQPAFPLAWTTWIAFLVALPTFAVMQLVWLIGRSIFSRKSRWKGNDRGRVQDGYVVVNGSESGEEATCERQARARFWRTVHRRLQIPRCIAYATTVLLGLYQLKYHEHAGDIRFRTDLQQALADPQHRPSGYGRGEKIFIAAAFHQNEAVIPYWTRSMLDAIVYMGTDNVFVSIVENYSTDRSPELLKEFALQLDQRGVRNRILVQDEAVEKPKRVEGIPRIEFLAAIRNQALEPLLASGGYDKVLFSNDVFIEPESVIELLETRGGHFDFACGLDFGHFGAYDMWVLRDRIGQLTAGIWPYFLDVASYEAIKAEEPVPVFTCWNGIVVFQADPVLPVHLRSNKTLSNIPMSQSPPPQHPWLDRLGESPALTSPLAFRASTKDECYSSESFLLPYDFRRVMNLQRIYINPRVVVAYAWKWYMWHKWLLRQRYVKWFVEKVYAGAWMQDARLVVGDPKQVWTWDGGDCHPWW